eukprot:333366_1
MQVAFRNNEKTHLLFPSDHHHNQAIYCFLWVLKYFFFLSLIMVMILSMIAPKFGSYDGPLYPKITSSWICVIVILFLSGISIDIKQLQKSTLDMRLNAFIQFNIYIWFPITGYILYFIVANVPNIAPFNEHLLKGVIILCCLPTSTASCVVFTQSCNGNESAAIANTTIANLIGIVTTPALVFIFIGNLGDLSMHRLLIKLALRVMMPFTVGQIARYCGGKTVSDWLQRKCIKIAVKKVKEVAILFVIFCSLAQMFYVGFDASLRDVMVTIVMILFLNVFNGIMIWTLSGISCGYDTYSIYDRIPILFVSIQKSAAVGLPIIEAIYENDKHFGLYILPVIMYQPIQALTSSLLMRPLTMRT